MSHSIPTIALIEELAFNAVPALVTQELDGWRLRFNMGATRRANSVLAVHAGAQLDLERRLAMVEAFYARHGLPSRFQLCPASRPAGLAETLLARGYRSVPGAFVQTGPLDGLLAADAAGARVSERFAEAWLAAYVEGEGEPSPTKADARRTMLQRIGPPAGFAAVERDGQIAAVALGVVERGWLGMFNVATRPAFRRRGLARAALAALAGWATAHGAAQSYLQVAPLNAPAQALYAGMGFTTLYEYTYYEREVS